MGEPIGHHRPVRLTVLGSSGGYPGRGLACSGYLLESGRHRLWLDAGSGTLARLLSHCSLADVESAWITHLHPDHWTDLPLAIHALALGAGGRSTPLPVFGPSGWSTSMGAPIRWRLEDPEPVFTAHELRDGLQIASGGVVVEAIAVEHGLETYGLRVSASGNTLAYSADSRSCEALHRLAEGADLFLCEVGTLAEDSPLHMTPRQAGEIATGADVRMLVLTHLPPTGDPARAIELAQDRFPGAIALATEGATFEVGNVAS
jgi:ribonuclease BN (tRNA processing enzyme)